MAGITRNFSNFEDDSQTFGVGSVKDGKQKKTVPVSLEMEFQTPRLAFVEDVELSDSSVRNSFLKVTSDKKGENFAKWMASFDDWVIERLKAASVDIWGKSVSEETIREMYKPTISTNKNMKLYWPRCKSGGIKVRVVSPDNSPIDIPEVITQGSRIVSIIRCRQVNIYSSQVWAQWEIRTFTLKAPKIVEKPQCIIEDGSDSDSDSDYYDDV